MPKLCPGWCLRLQALEQVLGRVLGALEEQVQDEALDQREDLSRRRMVSRSGKLDRARSRLYRGQILRLK